MGTNPSIRRLEDRLSGTGSFVYKNSYWLVVISLFWTLSSIALVTIGPATLGAYVAIRDLDSDRNHVEYRRVLSVVRSQFVPATALGLLPPLFFGLSAAYLYSFSTGVTPVKIVFLTATFYVGIYLTLVMIPTFVALSDGRAGVEALRIGVRWVARNPRTSMTVGVVTLLIFLSSVLFTVAFVLLYAGIAFSVQLRVVGTPVEVSSRPS